jgi:hypothetical protein
MTSYDVLIENTYCIIGYIFSNEFVGHALLKPSNCIPSTPFRDMGISIKGPATSLATLNIVKGFTDYFGFFFKPITPIAGPIGQKCQVTLLLMVRCCIYIFKLLYINVFILD